MNGNWQALKTLYADTAKVMNNVTKEKGVSIEATIKDFQQDHELFSSISFDADDFEMVVTDEGETWVNYWGVWKATLKANGEKFEMPLHITQQFINQKIVLEYGYWNSSAVALALTKLEAATP